MLKSGNTQTEIEAVALTRIERAVNDPIIVGSSKIQTSTKHDERAAFAYMKTGEARIVDGDKELKELLDKELVQTALQAGPRLVRNSKVDTNPVAEGFKDAKVLTNRVARTSIGITAELGLPISKVREHERSHNNKYEPKLN